MTKMFFEENDERINEIRTLLLNYHLEFEQLKRGAEIDFTTGQITAEEYDQIRTFRMNEYHTTKNGTKSPYSLSKSQVDLIKKYAQLDEEGNLMLDSINQEVRKNQDLLHTIFESIRIFTYYHNLPLSDQIETLSTIIADRFNDIIARYNAGIKSGATSLTIDNEIIDARYLPSKIRNLELHKQEALDRIKTSSQEEIIKLIAKFYEIDYSYYHWFKIKSLQSDAQNTELYIIHQNRLATIKMHQETISAYQQKHELILNGLQNSEKSYLEFQQSVAEISQKEEKPSLITRLKKRLFSRKRNNLNSLRAIFAKLSLLPNFSLYIKTLDSYNETDEFTIYMANKYPMINCVDEIEFKQDLISSLDEFYQNTITTIQNSIKEVNKIICDETSLISAEIEIATTEAAYLYEVSQNLYEYPQLHGLNSEEQERIFIDMKWYLTTVYPKDIATIEEKRNQNELPESKRGLK